MKIIDKNKDYYDFYQNIYRDDTFTFDRRDSYVLSKEEFASYFDDTKHHSGGGWLWEPGNLILLQVSHRFWLFNLKEKLENYKCVDYDLELLETWKNYDSDPVSIKLSKVARGGIFWFYKSDREEICNPNTNQSYSEYYVFNEFKLYKNGKYEIKTIPILKNIGIATFVDPLDIYLGLEEYFGEMKTNSEITDPIGMSNDDKITTHGFDTKVSFRKM